MSGNPNCPYSLPLVLEQPEAWPFDLIIKDADGYEVISQRRYAHTSKDKSVADAVDAVNFDRGERDHAAFCNAEQVARFNLVVTAVNSYASSQAEIERLTALEAELWRLSLVIESAVRNADRPNHAEVLALIKSIKRPDASLSGSKE